MSESSVNGSDTRIAPLRRRLRNPLIRFVVLATFMFVGIMVGMLFWPGDEPVDWRQTLLNSVVFALGFVGGTVVAERRYGRQALRNEQHPKARAAMWTEIAVFAAIAAVAIVLQKLLQ